MPDRFPRPNSGIQIVAGRDGRSGASAAIQPDMTETTSTRASATAKLPRRAGRTPARRPSSARTNKPKVVEPSLAIPRTCQKVIKQHEWNEYDIVARGNHIVQKINGQLMCEVTDEDTMARKDASLRCRFHAGPP